MAKQLIDYEKRLREMIMQRRNIDVVEPWLEAQLEAAAMNWQMVGRTLVRGSTGGCCDELADGG